MILFIINFLFLLIIILISVSFFTLFERKILSYLQFRKGPNKVGILGLFQALSDGVKLFSKEFILLYQYSMLLYFISPCLMFIISMMLWILNPFLFNLLSLNNMMLLLFCLLSLNVYPLMFMGYSSNSIYAMLGAMRSISQTISYEVSFILLIFSFLILIESLNILNLMNYNFYMIIILFPLSIILYVSILAELNRTPFDLSEGESELISGYNIEYMGSGFALIFLGEYSNIMFLMMIFVLLNTWGVFLFIYLIYMIMLYLVIMIRSLLPRIRYDKLMIMIWLNYLPISLNYIIYIMLFKYFLMSYFM